jgi:hypothetical protein
MASSPISQEYVGDVGGAPCGARSLALLIRTKGNKQPHRTAKCNRWANHGGLHIERSRATFTVLAAWTEEETQTRDDST